MHYIMCGRECVSACVGDVCGCVYGHVCRGCVWVGVWACVSGMCVGVCMGMCVGVCMDMCVGVCMGMCALSPSHTKSFSTHA